MGTTYGGRNLPPAKGGGGMVTYENLYAFCMVIIAVIALVLDFTNRRK